MGHPWRVVVPGTESRLILTNKTFANCQRNAKSMKVFIRERNPLYGKVHWCQVSFDTATCDSMLVQRCSCHIRTVGLCVQLRRERKSDTLSIQNICRLTLPFISTVCTAKFQKFQFEKLRMSQLHSSPDFLTPSATLHTAL